MAIKKFNEKFGPNVTNFYNITDFEFYSDFNSGETTYHFLYKGGKVEGDIILGYGSFGSKDIKPYISHMNLVKGEDILDDKAIVDLELFLDDNIDDVLNSKKLNEDSDGGGPAVAGMGAVVSAQPSSLAGSTIGSNFTDGGGTVGSGDVSVPYNTGSSKKMSQLKIPLGGFTDLYTNKKNRKKKSDNTIDLNQPVLDFTPKSNVMSYTDFIKFDLNKPKKVKQ
jgi:hypothetical protein|tara:strand:- start:264 stop:932 length:669 start_codon:yes stop_codon:yes gene_type:complete